MRTVFFDLDGTLTDPRPGIVRSVQYALERLGRPVPAEEDLLGYIGPPLRQSFVRLLEEESEADNGTEGVGVLYGCRSLEELVRAGARTIVVSVIELSGALTLSSESD